MICQEGPALLGPHAHPEVTIHTPPLSDYVACLEAGDLPGAARVMWGSAQIIADAGADLLICPDNTIHQAIDHLPEPWPRPFLHIANVTAQHARLNGYVRAGILGTRWLVESDVYPQALAAVGIEWVRPDKATLHAVDQLIMDDLVYGRFSGAGRTRVSDAVQAFADQGCDCVILGCTELPLLLDAAVLPLLDTTTLLARAALSAAVRR